MDVNELKHISRNIDIKINNTKDWIKNYYGNVTINPQKAIDMQSIELDRQLENYYRLRAQKDEILKQYRLSRIGWNTTYH